ncbi:PaaI family thioesterase [Natronorubrum sediminis]|nr:PaaI family thioesterase [Natronorubrum sediminis]
MTAESATLDSDVPQRFLEHSAYLSWLGIQIDTLGSASATIRLPAKSKHFNPAQGTSKAISGGVISTLIDISGGFAIWTTCDDPERAQLSTIDMNVSFLHPASDDLIAVAEVVRSGDTFGVVEVTVESADEGDRVVATGRATYRIGTETSQ